MTRQLAPGQRSRIHTLNLATGEDRIIHESDAVLYEAPNWTADGSALIINGDGHLFRLELSTTGAESAEPAAINFGSVPPLNNDHVLDPNGTHVYFSANDWHIYHAPLAGGEPVRVTNDDGRLHFLHGVSPDGKTLTYIGIDQDADGNWGAGNVWAIPSAGGEDVALTNDRFPDDGAEFSPDGSWIYFNSERADTGAGHAQIFRMRADGSGIEQLTSDERVNWFPHVSPDNTTIAFISFPAGTQGHPADRECILRTSDVDGNGVEDVVHLFGGQGTINVPSWSPDSTSIAYVDYPLSS